jgi:hypothetical protein
MCNFRPPLTKSAEDTGCNSPAYDIIQPQNVQLVRCLTDNPLSKTSAFLGIQQFFALIVAVAACVLSLPFPDLDIRLLGIGAHRNFLFHSTAIVLILHATAQRLRNHGGLRVLLIAVVVGCGVGVGVHLFADVFQSHPVRFPFIGSLIRGTSIDDRLWLLFNSIAGFAVAFTSGIRLRRELTARPWQP